MFNEEDIGSLDHYHTLKLDKFADSTLIKKAYHRLALRFHPDKVNSTTDLKLRAQEKFKKVNAAYEILSDVVKRKSYDRARDAYVKKYGDGISSEDDIWDNEEGPGTPGSASTGGSSMPGSPGGESTFSKDETESEYSNATSQESGDEFESKSKPKTRRSSSTKTGSYASAREDTNARPNSSSSNSNNTSNNTTKSTNTPFPDDHPSPNTTKPPTYSMFWLNQRQNTPYYKSFRARYTRAEKLYHDARRELAATTVCEMRFDMMQRMVEVRKLERDEARRQMEHVKKISRALRRKKTEENSRVKRADREWVKEKMKGGHDGRGRY